MHPLCLDFLTAVEASPPELAGRTLAQSIDSINACIQLRAAQEPNLQRWLAAQQ